MNTLLRNLNTLLLAGILTMMILVFVRMPPVRQAGANISRFHAYGEPIPVIIDNKEAIQVEITR